jgi:hypothetical protein
MDGEITSVMLLPETSISTSDVRDPKAGSMAPLRPVWHEVFYGIRLVPMVEKELVCNKNDLYVRI